MPNKIIASFANKSLLALASLILLLVTVCYGFIILSAAQRPFSTDYAKFYQSAQFFWQHKNIYTPVVVDAATFGSNQTGQRTLAANLNPPFLTLLLAPLAYFDYSHSLILWTIISIALAIASLKLVQRYYLSDLAPMPFLVICAAFFSYFPMYANVQCGQISTLLLLLLTGIWLAARQQQDIVAGMLLGLAGSIKPYFGLLFIFFVLLKRWRLLMACGLTGLSCGLLTIALFGQESLQQYHTVIDGIQWYSSTWNASLYGFFSRVFGTLTEHNQAIWQCPLLAKLCYGLTSCILLGYLIKNTCKHVCRPTLEYFDLGFAFTVIAMLLISPLGWLYYFPLLTIPILIVLRQAHLMPQPSYWQWGIIATIWLSGLPNVYLSPQEIQNTAWILTWGGYPLYALIGLAIICLTLQNHCATKCPTPSPAWTIQPLVFLAVLLPSLLGIMLNTLRI